MTGYKQKVLCCSVRPQRTNQSLACRFYTRLNTIVEDQRAIQNFDISVDGSCLAAGTEYSDNEAHIIFWCARSPFHRLLVSSSLPRDIRSGGQPTHINTSAHSDDISTIRFHSKTPHLLLSASTDGLLCTTDVREVDEDESGLHVGNWGCSVSNVGWTDTDIGGGGGRNGSIWAHSDMQTVSLWSDEVSCYCIPTYFVLKLWTRYFSWISYMITGI